MAEETDTPAAWHYARDGQKFGPVWFDDLRQLAGSGGLRPADLVWTDGMPQWTAAGAVPALAAAFAGPGGPPPPLPTPAHQGYAAGAIPLAYVTHTPPGAAAGQAHDPAMRWLLPVGRSGWAIAAGYLGLLSVLGCLAPFSLIVSIIAIRDIRKHPHLHGMGRAVFGLVMGILGTGALLFFLVVRLAAP